MAAVVDHVPVSLYFLPNLEVFNAVPRFRIVSVGLSGLWVNWDAFPCIVMLRKCRGTASGHVI